MGALSNVGLDVAAVKEDHDFQMYFLTFLIDNLNSAGNFTQDKTLLTRNSLVSYRPKYLRVITLTKDRKNAFQEKVAVNEDDEI